jgi:hypothetical protein
VHLLVILMFPLLKHYKYRDRQDILHGGADHWYVMGLEFLMPTCREFDKMHFLFKYRKCVSEP